MKRILPLCLALAACSDGSEYRVNPDGTLTCRFSEVVGPNVYSKYSCAAYALSIYICVEPNKNTELSTKFLAPSGLQRASNTFVSDSSGILDVDLTISPSKPDFVCPTGTLTLACISYSDIHMENAEGATVGFKVGTETYSLPGYKCR